MAYMLAGAPDRIDKQRGEHSRCRALPGFGRNVAAILPALLTASPYQCIHNLLLRKHAIACYSRVFILILDIFKISVFNGNTFVLKTFAAPSKSLELNEPALSLK